MEGVEGMECVRESIDGGCTRQDNDQTNTLNVPNFITYMPNQVL